MPLTVYVPALGAVIEQFTLAESPAEPAAASPGVYASQLFPRVRRASELVPFVLPLPAFLTVALSVLPVDPAQIVPEGAETLSMTRSGCGQVVVITELEALKGAPLHALRDCIQ